MRKLLICDLDGTLIDSRQDLTTATNLMRESFGLAPLSVETVTSYVGNGARKLVERALQGTDVNVDEALSLMKMHYLEHMCDQTSIYPGVESGLVELKHGGWVLAVVTNKPQGATERILAHLQLADLFGHIIGGGSFPLKPDPASILFLMRETGTAPDQTWIIGDNYTDLAAGRNAGIKRCFARYGFGQKLSESAELDVDSFSEFNEKAS